jgi:hypothetical protein
LEDSLEHTEFNDLKDTTKVVMAGRNAFFDELQATFGYRNEQMEAERALQTIQRRGLVSKYKAEFQTMVVHCSIPSFSYLIVVHLFALSRQASYRLPFAIDRLIDMIHPKLLRLKGTGHSRGMGSLNKFRRLLAQ